MMHHDETAALLPAAHQSSKRDNCCVRLIRIFPLLTSMLLAMFFYIAYFTFHLLHFLNLPRTDSRFYWGLFQTISYNALFCLFFISLILCWLVHPGRIPDSAPWIWPPLDKETQSQLPLRLETKAQSENRYCVICQRWKPDRAHHCRACGVCVLKMDHHCPWVNNCVGFRNYKYFYLCVWYAQWGLSFQCATSIESLLRLLKDTQSQFISVFAAYCNVCLAGLGAFLLGILLCFHSFLISRNSTTIEWCEMTLRKQNQLPNYNLGVCRNWKDTLGPNLLVWVIPWNFNRGTGLSYETTQAEVEEPVS